MNPTEKVVYNELRKAGFRVLRGGWPDFLAVAGGSLVRAVEVKFEADKVRPQQQEMHDAFSQYLGLDVEVIHFRNENDYPIETRLEREADPRCAFCGKHIGSTEALRSGTTAHGMACPNERWTQI